MKLGLLPPTNAPALRIGPALTGQVPAHPVAADHLAAVASWFLGGNDRFGTCGPTSVANYYRLVYKGLLGEDITVTDEAIWDLYRRSGNPNFDPATGADDNGVVMQTMLDALHAGGLDIIRADGTQENVKPVAFAKLDLSNIDEVRAAISIFGGVDFGLDLETAQQSQTDTKLWDYAPSPEWGGHAVMAGLYTSDGQPHQSDISIVTWAEVVGTTDAFTSLQLGEAWAIILPAHLDHPAFQQGVDLATLAADYEALTGRPFPVAPQPQPGPTPTPVPPGPAPGPVPGPDPHDMALVDSLSRIGRHGWLAEHHVGDNRRAAAAVEVWARSKGYLP